MQVINNREGQNNFCEIRDDLQYHIAKQKRIMKFFGGLWQIHDYAQTAFRRDVTPEPKLAKVHVHLC